MLILKSIFSKKMNKLYFLLVIIIVYLSLIILFNFSRRVDVLLSKIFLKHCLFQLFFPKLNVFSPNPIKFDLKIFYKDLYYDKTESKMQEILFYDSNSSFILNKYLRKRGYLYSVLSIIVPLNKNNKINNNKLYLDFKKKILSINFSEKIKTRQIIVLKTFGFSKKNNHKILIIDYIDNV